MKFKPNEIDDRRIVNCSETSDVVEFLVEAYTSLQEAYDELTDTLDRQEDRIDHLESQLASKTETIEQTERENQQLRDRVAILDGALSSYREENERDKAEIRQDVTENTRQTEENNAHTEAVARKVENSTGREHRTPLEQIVRLPDEIVHRAKLTANQRRARTVAMDIGGLATTVPKGKRLDSTTIKDRLEREYGSAHDQTVARVMSFLDRLGGERTEIVHTGKGKAVIVDDWLARRLNAAEQFATETVDRVLTNVVSVTTGTGG